MADNSFAALVQDVNAKLSEMSTAISDANGAAAAANNAIEAAQAQTEAAQKATQAANDAAAAANAEAETWENATASATTVAEGGEATVALSEADGKKQFAFGIPAGKTGAQGPQGPMGKAGVTFSLSGTTLNITTG